MSDLATQFSISRRRISQIIRGLGGPDADTARAVRRELRDEQQSDLVKAFLDQYQVLIADLAASGLARADIESKFALLLPDTPLAIIRDGLIKAEVIFEVNKRSYSA